MKTKIQLVNSGEAWDTNRRYKINAIVTYSGSDWQNTTGINSEPGIGNDWTRVSGNSQTLQEVSNNGGFDNGSTVKKGTTDAGNGGAKGVALKCSLDYEFKWEAGRLYIMQQDGFTIRDTLFNFTNTPTVNDDDIKGFVVNSRWILDNGNIYVCTDATTGDAVWELVNTGTIPTLQQILNNNHDLVNGNNFQGTGAGVGNTGSSVIGLGLSSAFGNIGVFINALGEGTAYLNIGNHVNAFGHEAGQNNTFNNVNLFGYQAIADENGQTVLSKDGTIMARISTTNLTATRKYNLPNASGTFALTSDITTPTLQEVTDEGNETVNAIKVIDTSSSSTQLQQNGLVFEDLDDLGSTLLVFENTAAVSQEVFIRGLGGTMALTSDIPTGVNNSTSVVLTSSNLNSTYPTAITGFKVYCTDIIAGKMVYEKTPSGWIGYACIVP